MKNNEKDPIKIAKIFDFYVSHFWPIHRILVKSKISQRCKNCASSEKMIPISETGICTKCLEYLHTQSTSTENQSDLTQEFNTLFLKYKDQKSKDKSSTQKYDVLILFSGGKDSAYMTKRLLTEHPTLNILCLTLDNSFMSPVAKKNISYIIEKLNVDHITIKIKKSFYKKLFSHTLKNLNASGSYGTVDFSDGEFLLDTARQFAAIYNIPFIFCGYSKYQVENGLNIFHFESPKERELKKRTEVAGIPLNKIFVDSSDLNLWWQGSEIHSSDRIARMLYPLYAWNLSEEFIKDQVTKWGLIPNKEQSPIVTNHRMIPLLGVVDVHKFGYSSFEIEFCRMIREGKANKHHWQMVFEFLEYTSLTGIFIKESIEELVNELGLTLDELGIQFNS